MTYEQALDKLHGKDSKKLCRSTYLVRIDENCVGIKLYNSIIIRIAKNNQYKLNDYGYKTRLTLDRINQYAPCRVFQKNWNWYINDERTPFFNGVTVNGC